MNAPSPGAKAYTVCFSGTGCTRDEGEETRPQSDKNIYCKETGYIPVRLHKEISGDLKGKTDSVTVRGVGENDWYQPRDRSEALTFNGPLHASDDLLRYVQSYSGGNQYSSVDQVDGWAAAALALHGANLAALSGAQQYNLVGHSRGAVESIMAAWFLYAYGFRNVPVNIFAIDPVPGPGNWYGILTQLPPNVVNYVGIYAWDHLDLGFNALVPRPNGPMTGKTEKITLGPSWFTWWQDKWKTLADQSQFADPLAPGQAAQPRGYELYACRGRHGTLAGIVTSDGGYDPAKVNPSVAPVPQLVYKMARAYLTRWETVFRTKSAVDATANELRQNIHRDHAKFDAMGGGEIRTSILPNRPYARRISSISGMNPANTYYFEDVVGDPPYRLAYPVTAQRSGAGWVNWKFL
jgi:hypothetical protein